LLRQFFKNYDNNKRPLTVSANGLPMSKYSHFDVKATHLLISLGMSVTQKDPQYDRTMLHYWQRIAAADNSHILGVFDRPVNIADDDLLVPTNDHMETMVKLVSILAAFPEMVTHEMMRCLYELVKLNGCNHRGQNLLLTACKRLSANDQLETVRLLLRVGANPNSIDLNGNSSLHILAVRMGEDIHSPTADLLLDSGTHYDHVNWNGVTALEVWRRGRVEGSPLPSWSMRIVPNLVCWCARVITRSAGIFFEDEDLPKALHHFVHKH